MMPFFGGHHVYFMYINCAQITLKRVLCTHKMVGLHERGYLRSF